MPKKKKRKSQFQMFKESSDSFFKDIRESTREAFEEKVVDLKDHIKTDENLNYNKKQDSPVDFDKNEQVSKWTSVKSINKGESHNNQNVRENRASEQVNKWTSEQASGHLSGQLPEQVSKWTSEQVDNRTSEQVDNRASEQVASNLKQNQYEVLRYVYFNRPFKISGPSGIAKQLNIPYGTIRNCLNSLTKKGYIEKPYSINDGVNKGSNCRIIESKCFPLFGPSNILNPESKTEQVSKWTTEQVDNRTSEQVSKSYNSSSSLNKETTTCGLNEIEKALLIPELNYLRHKGLTVKQLQSWMNEFDCSLSLMTHYLCWYRFDLVENGKEESKPIRDIFDYFYKILIKSGSYPQPRNYKSLEDIRFEEEKKALAEQKRLADEAENVYREKQEAIKSKAFWDMMNNPNDEMYKKCFDSLNGIFKAKSKSGGKAFETAMRQAFDKFQSTID